ncbi:hypothetical protein B0T14DRAFT_78197 [Immersiella caudata]|uniref:Uncharacterized protein n=1 Tax=Immersiella caudata TaxID=314043 RepID=A0AA39XGW5_9PEZI|nr:hypothetical protein B0T14DRAFT_78197 [Immersiella caudata]
MSPTCRAPLQPPVRPSQVGPDLGGNGETNPTNKGLMTPAVAPGRHSSLGKLPRLKLKLASDPCDSPTVTWTPTFSTFPIVCKATPIYTRTRP